MAPNLTDGIFKIVSLIDGNPAASVDLTRPALQPVRLGQQVTTWVVRKDGDNSYRLAIGGYTSIGVQNDSVCASIIPDLNVEWHATYHELQDAYTIEPVDDPSKGWAVEPDSGDNPAIEIKVIIESRPYPPVYLTSQLFRFMAVDDE